MSAKYLYVVREVVSLVIDDDTPIATFNSFWEANDFIEEHPEMNLFIEMRDAVND